MKFLNAIAKLISSIFKKNTSVDSTNTIPPAKPVPEVPTKEEIDNFPPLKIALVRGHGGNDSGAIGSGTNEVEYNTWVLDYVAKHTKRNIRVFLGGSSLDAVLKSLTFKPDITIQFHLNDADSLSANGIEILVIDGDKKSYPLAEKFASNYAARFNRKIRRDKGKKLLGLRDRGAASVAASGGIKFLVEPFFINNPNDFVSKEEYAKFVTEFVDNI